MREYEITLEGKTVGKVTVETDGLYYLFSGFCRLPAEGFYELHVQCNGNRTGLGVCVPTIHGFTVRTKQTIKSIGRGDMEFFLTDRSTCEETHAVDIAEDRPFPHIDRLAEAHYSRKNGRRKIVFYTSREISSPTGQ